MDMVIKMEDDNDLKSNFIELAKSLNVDLENIDEAWTLFDKLKYAYSFEIEPIQWLMCSLYLIEQKNENIEQYKSFTLTKMLRSSNMSIKEFFHKIHKLHEIINYPTEYCFKINKIEAQFNVTSILFQKFENIFILLFKFQTIKQENSQNQFTSFDLFKFIWLLFIYSKERYPSLNGDLVNSFHLLLCCINLVYLNVIALPNKFMFINENFFKKISKKFESDILDGNVVIDDLCQIHYATAIETKTINEHYFKPFINQLIKREILFVNTKIENDSKGVTKLIDFDTEKNYFNVNSKILNTLYEEYVLTFGEIDERVFYEEYSLVNEHGYVLDERLKLLKILVGDLKPQSSNTLLNIFEKSSCTEFINEIFETKLSLKYSKSLVDDGLDSSHANLCLFQAKIIFYKVLENILTIEMNRIQNINLINLTHNELFIKSLFACSIETINYCHNVNKPFPYSINLLQIHPFNFIKTIEIFIRSEDNLSRDLVKHFNLIEEQILESYAWKYDSPIWKYLIENTLPPFEDVCPTQTSSIQSHLSSDLIINLTPNPLTSNVASTPSITNSPVKHPAITRVVCSSATSSTSNDNSKLVTSYKKSETKNTIITTISTTNSSSSLTPTSNTIHMIKQPERIIIAPVTKKTVLTPSSSTNTVLVQVQSTSSSIDKSKDLKRKHHSTTIKFFLRKFYLMACNRLSSLIEKLEINELFLKKLWNIFQFSITHCTDLIKDRHLDQLIICCIYVTCKIYYINVQFHQIIKIYRTQLNSNSSTYRQVLIRKLDSNEIRDDIIQFYNEIYIKEMKAYVTLYLNSDKQTTPNLHLSPVPKTNAPIFTPRKVINNDMIFVSPGKPQLHIQRSKLVFRLNKSPQRSLIPINEMIKRNENKIKASTSTNKRRLISDSELDDEADSSSQTSQPKITVVSANNFAKKLQNISKERINSPLIGSL